jgi:hypothetical protein
MSLAAEKLVTKVGEDIGSIIKNNISNEIERQFQLLPF